ncbi:MAG: cobalamin biosynthesis protein CobD [Oscillatoria sp. SIO1A7]|nr:cobalamin biosynthesis protein CobD [Oscillatoria sp. SIO1A7]
MSNSWTVVAIAAFLDYLIGDPFSWPHPVKVMGWFIARYTQLVLHLCQNPLLRRLAGIVLGIGLVAGSFYIGAWISTSAHDLNPLLGIAIDSILLGSCFAGRSLRSAAEDVLATLPKDLPTDLATDLPTDLAKKQDIPDGDRLAEARQQLSMYVGRDTENLPLPEILRAVLETVSENAVDGVTAPLFYALVGAIMAALLGTAAPGVLPGVLPGVGPVSFALAYKAASTLDSMVGYREEPYKDLGYFSAKLEDALTWLPCRLTVITLGLISLDLGQVWQRCQQDATKDPSPNAGWSECAYAVILGVQLGGTNYYRGVAKKKPLLGKPVNAIAQKQITHAFELTRYCFLIWLFIPLWLGYQFYW